MESRRGSFIRGWRGGAWLSGEEGYRVTDSYSWVRFTGDRVTDSYQETFWRFSCRSNTGTTSSPSSSYLGAEPGSELGLGLRAQLHHRHRLTFDEYGAEPGSKLGSELGLGLLTTSD